MKNIEITKSRVVLLRSLGKTTEEIATIYSVTSKEMSSVLMGFGLTKPKKAPVEKTYTITPVDDLADAAGIYVAEDSRPLEIA
jgi:hypothetical protein